MGSIITLPCTGYREDGNFYLPRGAKFLNAPLLLIEQGMKNNRYLILSAPSLVNHLSRSLKLLRLGKHVQVNSKLHPIKIVLNTPGDPFGILRNTNKLQSTSFIANRQSLSTLIVHLIKKILWISFAMKWNFPTVKMI